MDEIIENETIKKKAAKGVKSVNILVKNIERVDNYISTTGASFSDIVDKGIDLFFEALEKGNNKLIEGKGIEEPDKTLLIPISLYIKMKNTSFTQVNNLIKKNKLRQITLTDKNGDESSRFKYITISEKHPDYFLAKIALASESIVTIEKRIDTTNEEIEKKIQLAKIETEEDLKKLILELEKKLINLINEKKPQ